MLDPAYIRDHLDDVKRGLQNRGMSADGELEQLATLEREARAVALATPQQVAEIVALLNVVRLPEGLVEKWFSKANVDQWEDMPADAIAKCTEYVKSRFPAAAAA